MKKLYIHDNWRLFGARADGLSASVPGCVHTDLLSHGVISDPFWRDNSKDCVWIENCDWTYRTSFDAPVGDDVVLVFEGLDTYTEIYLNDKFIGKTEDMFIPHRFDVSEMLKEKGNELEVRFLSPIEAVRDFPERVGAFTTERINSRRIQCTYSWDWCERFVTAGIWRPVYLEYANGIDIDSVYVYTESIDKYSAQLYTRFEFKNFDKGAIATVEIISPDGEVVASDKFYADMPRFVRRYDIANPALWYPSGYGEQPLYKIRVSVGENVHEESFGIRTLKIVQLPDKEGTAYREKAKEIKNSDAGKIHTHNDDSSGFFVLLNGERIFCRGGNWVPCEPFPSAESDEKIRLLVREAKEMGANFLRVWGGGLFEREAFYDECDKCGILVAQDFLMACGDYPEKENWFIEALRKESAFAVKYLRNHPSLAWWHGDNENAMRGSDTQEFYSGRLSALLGAADSIYENDPYRAFLPSSPYGGDTYASLTKGTAHITNYIGEIFQYCEKSDCVDYKEYLEQYIGRFVSEDGTFGAASRPSMLKFMTEDDLIFDDSGAMIEHHTKGNPALPHHFLYDIIDFSRKVLGDFEDGEDRFFKYKYIQYEWIRVAFENHRRNLGYSNGLVLWMFNDCWPAAMGWSLVDYYNLPKASYYSFKRLSAPVVASVKPDADKYTLYVSSDNEHVRESVAVKAYLFKNDAIIDTYESTVDTCGYGVVTLDLPFSLDKSALVVCDISYSGGKDRCFYKDGALNIVSADERVSVIYRTENSVTVKANGYVHALELEGELIFDDNYFSMLDGEVRTVSFRAADGAKDMSYTVKAYTLK